MAMVCFLFFGFVFFAKKIVPRRFLISTAHRGILAYKRVQYDTLTVSA